jgi:hypothetical protein
MRGAFVTNFYKWEMHVGFGGRKTHSRGEG